jgi:hypothetical protein
VQEFGSCSAEITAMLNVTEHVRCRTLGSV